MKLDEITKEMNTDSAQERGKDQVLDTLRSKRKRIGTAKENEKKTNNNKKGQAKSCILWKPTDYQVR